MIVSHFLAFSQVAPSASTSTGQADFSDDDFYMDDAPGLDLPPPPGPSTTATTTLHYVNPPPLPPSEDMSQQYPSSRDIPLNPATTPLPGNEIPGPSETTVFTDPPLPPSNIGGSQPTTHTLFNSPSPSPSPPPRKRKRHRHNASVSVTIDDVDGKTLRVTPQPTSPGTPLKVRLSPTVSIIYLRYSYHHDRMA